jgi:Ni/Co efflux regulator RcnB
MKKLIAAAVAASVLSTPVLAAPFHGPDNRGRVEQKHRTTVIRKKTVVRQQIRQPDYRRWSKGQRFDSRYARNYRQIANARAYRLHDAPRGYRWVQSGNDAVLVGIASGIVASVIAGVIR